MRIGIVGAGNVGGTLGSRWAQKGHEVEFGSRNPASAEMTELVKSAGGKARAGTVAEAAAFGEAIAVATPWGATQQALKGAGNLSGKVLLDCTNPLKEDLSGLDVGHATSGAELVAGWAAGARVVKIFNTTGFGNMANPRYGGSALTMLYCGDDAAAKQVAATLASDLGFEPVDAGPLAEARQLEHLALLWIHLAVFRKMGMDFGFQLIRR